MNALPGAGYLFVTFWGATVSVALGIPAALRGAGVLDGPWAVPGIVWSIATFAVGVVACLLTIVNITIRARNLEEFTVSRAFFLATGVASRPVVLFFRWLLIGTTILAVLALPVYPWALAAPMFVLGLTGLYGTRFGELPSAEQAGLPARREQAAADARVAAAARAARAAARARTRRRRRRAPAGDPPRE